MRANGVLNLFPVKKKETTILGQLKVADKAKEIKLKQDDKNVIVGQPIKKLKVGFEGKTVSEYK